MRNKYKVHPLKLRKNRFINYSYLVVDKASGDALIIDPSWEIKKIDMAIENLSVNLKYILLTHSHFDHVNLVPELLQKYNTEVFMSSNEIEYYGFRCGNLNAVHNNEQIFLGSTKVVCLLTPGHTSGSTSYLIDNHLFTGDFLFIEGCGICSCEGSSTQDMFNSIQRVRNELAPDTLIYPAHSYGKEPGYSLEYLLKNNVYFCFDNISDFADFRLREGQCGIFSFK